MEVPQKSGVACRIYTPAQGTPQRETRTFGTTTRALPARLDWLRDGGCTHAALESTGEYGRPVYNLREGHLELLLVNARPVKNGPGRKTDVGDAEWLADRLRQGLLKARFVPPKPQRQLRALTRQRSNLGAQRALVVNWLQQVLEDANIKLASVATDVTGVSARARWAALIAGHASPEVRAAWARGRMRSKRVAWVAALTGFVDAQQRFLWGQHLTLRDCLEAPVEPFNEQITAHREALSLAPEPPASPRWDPGVPPGPRRLPEPPPTYRQPVAVIDPLPGIDLRGAEAVLAETGPDLRRFPSAAHLTSGGGVAPGNRESGGKRYSGKTTPGNPALRKALVQAAQGAIRTQGSYFGALYHRLASRRGKKRAIVAVARALLVVIYHVLRYQEPYRELGGNYFDARKKETVVQNLVRRLERLGHHVSLSLVPEALAA